MQRKPNLKRKPRKTLQYDDIIKRPNLCVAYYLMSSYLYYVLNKSVFTDAEFDDLCLVIIRNWKKIDHPHKYLLDRESLACGSGFAIKSDAYPGMVRGAAMCWLEESGA